MCESGLVKDKIDALKDLDVCLDDEQDEDDLEEGEFVPKDVPEWKSEEEVIVEDDEEIDEYVIIQQKMTKVVDCDEKVLNEVNSDVNNESQAVEENVEEINVDFKNRKAIWFKKLPKQQKIKYMDKIVTSGSGNFKKGIISWFYDKELKLFVIKRHDGLQYLENKRSSFNSLPYCELKELAKMELRNIGDDPMAEVMARIIRREVFSEKFDQLSPRKGRRIVDKSRIDPETGRPWTRMIYKPVKCLEEVQLKKLPQDILGNMTAWFVDAISGEAVMESDPGVELLRIYDPLHLVNLSKNDLLKLHSMKILSMNDWIPEAQKYKRVVKVCVEQGVHARVEV